MSGLSEEVSIFLDTTLTYDDPFFKKAYNKQLIRLSKIHKIPLYMSKVVFDETRNKFEQNVEARMGALKTALRDLDSFYPSTLDAVTINCSFSDFMHEFDSFYSELINAKVLVIIDYENDLLPILVERSIKRKKPFGNKKQEFRDAITWLSYVGYTESNDLFNCFLITQNKNDFCEDGTRNSIHPDLLEDSTRFQLYFSARELLEKEPKLGPFISSSDITEWLNQFSIDNDFLSDLFETKFSDIVEKDFSDYVDVGYRCDFVDDKYLPDVDWNISVDSANPLRIGKEINIMVTNDQVVIEGDIYVTVSISLFLYGHYGNSKACSEDVQLFSGFTFTMDKDTIYTDSLEFYDFQVTSKANFRWYFSDEDTDD